MYAKAIASARLKQRLKDCKKQMARFLMRVRQFSSATNSHKKPRYDCAVVASAGILGVPKLDLRCFRLSPANFNLSCSPRTAILCPKMNVTPNLLIG
jgi:hypothetical protein